jgi:hypothetical protein
VPAPTDEERFGQAVPGGPDATPHPGDLVVTPGHTPPEVVAKDMVFEMAEVPEPLVGEDSDTPLADDEPEGVIPSNPLWAMKNRRHGQWHLFHHGHPERLRAVVGSGADAVYAMDDGRDHVMLGRPVGSSPSGCQYCLVGRVPRGVFDSLQSRQTRPQDAFAQAEEIALCGVIAIEEVKSGETFDVASYETAADIPREYLPGSDPIAFPSDIEIDV